LAHFPKLLRDLPPFITQGELILTLDGKETRFRAGEWYQVRAKATHAARFDVETSEIEFWFHTLSRA
jgi:quercetin dioxygenase-like cupin family protein